MLSVRGITVQHGKAVAINDVSLEVPEGSVVSIVGANGAGKTTLLRAVSGLVPLQSGEILLDGTRIDGTDPSDIVKRGLVHVPEGRQLFPYLTVLTNLELGASLRKDKDGIKKDMDEVFEYFPVLRQRRRQKAGTLSGGEQEMLAIGRGLMAGPRVLLMNEPSLGLSPRMVRELAPVIKNINNKGVSVLLVEQSISLVLRTAHFGYALQIGKVVMEGDIAQFKTELIKQAYLG